MNIFEKPLIEVQVSIVIPVYNSELILPKLLCVIRAAMSGMTFEVILVNDGSSDKSWQVITSLSQDYPELKGVCLTRNFGQDNAIMAGLHFVRGAYVVIMDDDLQHSPQDIPELIKGCEAGFDVCYADYSADKRQKVWKNIGSGINTKLAELFTGKPPEIYISPFKAIRRVVVDIMVAHDGPYPYIDGLIFRATKSVTQVPVEHHERYAGNSNYNLVRSISVFLKHMTGFSILPLRVSSLLGFCIAIVGLFLAVYYSIEYFRGGGVEGWTTLVVLQLVLGGAILMSLGIVGEYVGRLYLLAGKTPQFAVRSTVN